MIDRIVVLNDLSEPKGGATALALASAVAFRERGHGVTFLTGDAGDDPALAWAGIEAVGLGRGRLLARSPLSAALGGLYDRGAEAMVARRIAERDTPRTIYHLHGWAQILSPSVFRALRPVRDRLVISAHDFFLACPNGAYAYLKTGAPCPHAPLSARCLGAGCDRDGGARKAWRVARQTVQRRLYAPTTSPPVLAVHEAMRPLLMRAGVPDAAIETLPNPVTPYSRTRIAAERNGQALFVGRLERTKGPDLAAAACRAAGVTLRLVGDGAMRAELERDYPEMVFTGRLPPERIAEEAARARVLLMPSRYPEPYGLVAAEALWSGLPVIAADTAFLARDIVRAGAGLAIEPRNTGAFATALASLADDARVAAMSRAAFAGTRSIGLTPDAWVDRLLDAYRRRLAGAGRSEIAFAHADRVAG